MVWRGWEAKPWIRLRVLGLLLLALPGCQSFLPNFWSRVLTLSWDSYTHQYMTEQAILNVTMETLKGLPGQHHSGSQRHEGLGRGFLRAVGEVVRANAGMDFISDTCSDPVYHFDSERVDAATEMLRKFWNDSVLLVKAREYQGARQNLGKLFHSLQDFYSHSNWVEMGQKTIYQHLLDPKAPAIPTASKDVHTCEECHLPTCENNILEVMFNPKFPLLTTGYFSDYPIKPPGKCSHGGILDSSRHQGARGGINKDSTSPFFSPHHYLHAEAAKLATMATLMVLHDLRDTVGPESFLRLFSVEPPVLVFVIDTTGSMFDEISAARLRADSIIRARARDGRHTLPGTFLLVPFHDPGVGPVYKTDDPEQFLRYLGNLDALGGGDEPEMCFTAIQLALTNSPPLSEIFVFTDASAKDRHLYDSVKALTLEKQSKVTFLLTEDTKRGMRRKRETLSPDRFSLYTSLASVSGGMTIFTSNKDIEKVSTIVQDTIATASKVTLLHAESHVDSDCSHAFQVDRSMSNVTLHLAGALTNCTLHSPNGHSQPLLGPPGPLAELQRLQGLYRVTLLPPIQRGQWNITAKAQGSVTFSVIGDSGLDFLYYLATEANETHPGLSQVEGSPIAGLPVFLVLSVTGLPPTHRPSFSHVTLIDAGGKGLQNVTLNSTSSLWMSEQELVGRIEAVPHTPFCVHLFGRDAHGNIVERVSSEMIQPTHVQIQVLSSSRLVPGHNTSVAFEVWNQGPARSFSLSAEDDHGYLSPTGPYSFHISERSSFSREVVLKTPRKAAAGEAVTLTLWVRARDSADSNYAVVHLTVIPQDNDTSPPSCSAMIVQTSCPENCYLGNWSVSLAVKDRGHSGLAAVQLSQGEGTLRVLYHGGSKGQHGRPQGDSREEGHGWKGDHMVAGEPRLSVTSWVGGRPVRLGYVSPCCAPTAELVVWDRAGNTRRCHLAARQQSASPVETNRASRQTGHPSQGLGLALLLISLLVTNV